MPFPPCHVNNVSVAGVSGGLLAARVCKAGGLGMIAAGHFQDLSKLEKEIQIFKEDMNDVPGYHDKDDGKSSTEGSMSMSQPHQSDLSIGFIGFSTLSTPNGWTEYEYILKHYRPKAVQFFAPSILFHPNDGLSNVKLAHENNTQFIAQVGSMSEAKEAIRHKVNAIICQGSEAGGHGLRRELGSSTMALASQVSKMTNIPVLAAGGIVNGKHLASALCVCDGASMGTRFWATKESIGNPKLQQELIKDNSCDDVVRTTVFDQVQNELSSIKWPHPYHSVGALCNQTSSEWDGKTSQELQNAIDKTELLEEYKSAQKASDPQVVCILSGEGVGEIDHIEGAYDVTMRIEEEAIDSINRLQSISISICN
jgi:nitronate monooxygenase